MVVGECVKRECIRVCVSVYVYVSVRVYVRVCVCTYDMCLYMHGLHLMLKGYMENTGCKGDSNSEKIEGRSDVAWRCNHSQSTQNQK